jgi:hypothetical protein
MPVVSSRALALPALAAFGLLAMARPAPASAASAIRPAIAIAAPASSAAIVPVYYYWRGGRYPYRWHGRYYHHRRWWHGYWRYY